MRSLKASRHKRSVENIQSVFSGETVHERSYLSTGTGGRRRQLLGEGSFVGHL